MKPLKKRKEWPKIAVYDIEAEKWVNVTLVCHVDEYGNRKAFRDLGSYLNWLFTGFEGDHVWAHWGGHYDHRFVIFEATKRGWQWETIQSGGMLIIVSVYHPNGKTINFCESARLMPDALKKIGKSIGLPKLDVDRSHIERLTQKEAVEYCLRDCDIVVKGLQYMKKALEAVGADFAYTLASIASRWVRRSEVLDWRRFYEKDETGKWEYSKTFLRADEFCLPAYFGGRVEVFKVGTFKKKLYYYDVRSSYPWSMTYDLPGYFEGFFPPPKRIDRALSTMGISEATVTIPDNTYVPILPIRDKGKLIFPTGTIKGRWTNLELQAARKRGAKVVVHAQARFKPMPFLRPFVETFYRLRFKAIDEGDAFRSYTYKICLNSLYGKLVESIERQSTLFGSKRVNRAIAVHGEDVIKPTPTPGVYALCYESEGSFRHVAAGAYVTARSRLRLFEGLELALKQGGNIYYCDTDSIITDVNLHSSTEHSEIMGDELGNFKLEAELSELEVVCPKVYRAITSDGDSIYKVKGMPVRGLDGNASKNRWEAYLGLNKIEQAIKQFPTPELLELADKMRADLEKEGITGFLTDLRQGRISPKVERMSRALRNPDSKRVHSGDGRSRPHKYEGMNRIDSAYT